MTPQLRQAVLKAGPAEVLSVRRLLTEAGDMACAAGDPRCLAYGALASCLARVTDDVDPAIISACALLWDDDVVVFEVIDELHDTDPTGLPSALASELLVAEGRMLLAFAAANNELEDLDGLPEGWL